MITMTHYLVFENALLFCISVAGIFINRKKNILAINVYRANAFIC